MQFVRVTYSLNQKFYVEDKAYEKMVKKVLKNVNNITIKDLKIKIDDKENNFLVALKIKIGQEKLYHNVAKEIVSCIEYGSTLLTTSKPKNIEIDFVN